MKEKVLREVVKEALKEALDKKEKKDDKETFAPKDKEHLSENKKRLNEELLIRWGFVKKDKK